MSVDAYENLKARAREVYLLRTASGVLEWDAETYLPGKAVPYRAEQLSYLGAKAHALFTQADVGDWLKAVEDSGSDTSDEAAANIREWRREYDRATKIPVELVEEFERERALARDAWVKARRESKYQLFEPHLQKLVKLVREKAERWGYEESPYDALLDQFEPSVTARELKPVFEELRQPLVDLLGQIHGKSVSEDSLDGDYPIQGQQALNREVAMAYGYDFDAGRIDTTAHPFQTTLGPFDQRMTTRYDEGRFQVSLYGVLHETGHALYEQGLDREAFGLPSGDSVSLGIHESQSRLWENHIGRTAEFWGHWYENACTHLPDLARFTPEQIVVGVQRVAPSFIRVEADEVTYDLHILLRFELELALMQQEITVGDLPAAWNERFYRYFGMKVPNDSLGVLQDIHWSFGGIGYFPTYTLGNLNAAQLIAAAEKQIPGLSDSLKRGEYQTLLHWLREKVHRHGRRLLPQQLMESVTGERTSAKYRIEYLRKKYGGV